MIKLTRNSALPLAAVSALLLAACGGGGSGGASTGTMRLALTDAPACGYDHVYVTVVAVKVHQNANAGENDAGWQTITLPSLPKRIDLLNLTNGVLEELGQTVLPAGTYTQMRLVLASNAGQPYANAVDPTGGSEVALTTPSGQQSGLKLNVNLKVEPGQLADFVLDFNACKSVVKAGNSGNFNLKPVIAVLPRVINSMAVDGYVDNWTPYSTVSLQLNGVVVRSTVPASNGYFWLPYLPATGTNYDLVIAGQDRGTRVVTSVPVTSSAITHVNDSLHPIVLANNVAQPQSVGGTVTAAGGIIPDATVSVLQSIDIGREIELASGMVNSVTGAYSFTLATDPVQKAVYANPLSWAAYNPSVAQFTVRSSVAGTTDQTHDVNLSISSDLNVNFTY